MIGIIFAGIWRSQVGRAVVLMAGVALALYALILAFQLWLSVHDKATADAARTGYVLLAEKAAAVAKADELQRQVNAGTQALEEHRKRLLAAELEDQQQTAEREQEILTYETLLSQANRRCALDRSDIEFLQHSGKAPEQRRVGNRSIPGKSKPAGPSGRLPGAGTSRGPQ